MVTSSGGGWVKFPEIAQETPYRFFANYFPYQHDGSQGKIKCECESVEFKVRFFAYPWPNEFYVEVTCSQCGKKEILSDYQRKRRF